MCDVISFATPRDGFRERGFVGDTPGHIWVLVLAEASQAHEFSLICHNVKSAEYSVFLEHLRGGVEISTLLSAALSLYTRYPIGSAFRPSASCEQRYFAYKRYQRYIIFYPFCY